MGTVADALRIAASQLGVAEDPPGSNNTPYSRWYGVRGAWCDMFVSWVLHHAGVPQGANGKGFAWVSDHRDWLAAQGRVFAADRMRPGDLAFFEWGTTPGGYDHVGIIEAVEGATVVLIEGNVGDRVQRIRRSRSGGGIREVGRPAYGPPPVTVPQVSTWPVLRSGSRGPAVADLQRKLNVVSGRDLMVDGVFGPATDRAVRDFQRIMGLRVDGIVGPRTWDALNFGAWVKVAGR